MKKESKSMIIETIITFDSEREDISVDNWNKLRYLVNTKILQV